MTGDQNVVGSYGPLEITHGCQSSQSAQLAVTQTFSFNASHWQVPILIENVALILCPGPLRLLSEQTTLFK